MGGWWDHRCTSLWRVEVDDRGAGAAEEGKGLEWAAPSFLQYVWAALGQHPESKVGGMYGC